MAIVVPTADYSPLYRALNFQAEARQASYLPKQMKLQAAGLDLQQRQLNASAGASIAGAVVGGVLSVTRDIIGLVKADQLEKQKQKALVDDQTFRAYVRDAVLNGKAHLRTGAQFGQEEGVAGAGSSAGAEDVSIAFDDGGDLEKMYQERLAAINKDRWMDPEVKSWAREQLYKTYSTNKEEALNYFSQKLVKDRAEQFAAGADQILKASVASEDPSAIDKYVDGASFLTDAERTNTKAKLHADYQKQVAEAQYTRAETTWRRIATDSGSAQALTLLNGQGYDLETKKKLAAAIEDQAKKAQGVHNDGSVTMFAEIVKAQEGGKSPGTPADAARVAIESVPEPYRVEVEKAIRSQQAAVVSGHTMDQMNQTPVRNDLVELRKLYESVKADKTGAYDGVAEQRQKDLNVIEARIKDLEPKQGVDSEASKQERARLLLKLARIRGEAANQEGVSTMSKSERVDATIALFEEAMKWKEGPLDIGSAFEDTIQAIVKSESQMVDVFVGDIAQKLGEALKGKAKGMAAAELDPYIDAATQYATGLIKDYASETGRQPSAKELADVKSKVMGLFISAQYAVTRKDSVQNTTRWFIFGNKPAEEQLSALQAQADRGELRHAVYQDSNGTTELSPSLGGTLEQLWALQTDKLASALKVDPSKITQDFAKDGADIDARKVFGYDGKKYIFRASPDGKTQSIYQLGADGKEIPWSQSDVQTSRDAASRQATMEAAKAREAEENQKKAAEKMAVFVSERWKVLQDEGTSEMDISEVETIANDYGLTVDAVKERAAALGIPVGEAKKPEAKPLRVLSRAGGK